MAQDDEAPGPLIETFTLSRHAAGRMFFEGKLTVELVDIAITDVMKTVKVRIASRAMKAEYGSDWTEHTYLEMLKYYRGDPISGSPFKCAEGWVYYGKSDDNGVTLSLRANPHLSSSFAYNSLLLLLDHWQKVVIGLALIGLAVAAYWYLPLVWGFLSIQHLAREHALQTGFPSSPVIVYLITRLPLIVLFYSLFDLFFSGGWKGVVAVALIAIGLQLFFNWHNTRQLQTYASIKHFTPMPDSKGRAVQGQVKGMPVALAVGGSFTGSAIQVGDAQAGIPSTYMSYLILEVSLGHAEWDGLALSRELDGSKEWSASRPVDRGPRVRESLAALSRLPRYSILHLEIKRDKLLTMKLFAPDTPAEIHLLVDLVVEVGSALEGARP